MSARFYQIFFLLAIAVLPHTVASAQFEGVTTSDYVKHVKALGKLYDWDNLQWVRDTIKGKEIMAALRQYAIKTGDKIQLFNADFGEIAYLALGADTIPAQRVITTLKSLIQREHENGILESEVIARRFLARFYWFRLKNYELAFEEYLVLDKILNNLSQTQFPEKPQTLTEIGKAYFYFKDYKLALSYLRKVPVPKADSVYAVENGFRSAATYEALAWQKLNQLDSSDASLWRLTHYAEGIKDLPWVGIAAGYLGYNQLLRKNYAQAQVYLDKGIEIAAGEHDTGWAIRQKLWLADAFYKQNRPQDANLLVEWALRQVNSNISQQPADIELYLYPMASKMYTMQGNTRLATDYLDSTFLLADRLNTEFNSLLVARVQQKAVIARQQKITDEKDAKIRERNILIGFVLLLLALAIYIYLLQNKKHAQQRQLQEARLRQQHTELENATGQLQDFTRLIADKNNLIEKMRQQFGEESDGQLLQELQNSSILTNHDWTKFKTLFEKVHGGYLQNLQQKLPGLSPTETRYMALAKLNLSNKEMAYSLGVTPESIRVTWHRLRKKLNLPEEVSLEAFVNSIG